MSNTSKYPAQVFWSEEDGGYIALAPDLPGCSAFGATEDEALKELREAEKAWIAAQQAAGNPIPSPSELPAPVESSGRVLLRMPKSLHAKLVADAKSEGVSLNQYILYRLAEGRPKPPAPDLMPVITAIDDAFSRHSNIGCRPLLSGYIGGTGQHLSTVHSGDAIHDWPVVDPADASGGARVYIISSDASYLRLGGFPFRSSAHGGVYGPHLAPRNWRGIADEVENG